MVRLHLPGWTHPSFISIAALALTQLAACSSPGAAAAGAVLTAGIGARTRANEIEQTYYVGVFDQLGQVPPTVYRLRVRGQSSAVSAMRFASGWLPAAVVDGLNERVGFDEKTGRVKIESADKSDCEITPARRLMMFGPEGFREAPKDHRLAIVMSSSPEKFFQLAGESLRVITEAHLEQLDSATSLQLLTELQRLRDEQRELDKLDTRLATLSEGK